MIKTAIAALGMCALVGSASAQAQSYPDRPIKLVVGFSPGGGSDTTARLLATALGTRLGQPIVVENRPGANTIIATQYVASQPADGYTLLFTSASFAINPSLQKLSYDSDRDFAPVALVDTIPLLLVTNLDVPAKSVGELIDLAKKQPGKLSYASFGLGSAAHLASEQLLAMTGTEMVHVPYKGSAPALADVMGGQVTMMMPGIGSAASLVKGGKVRALAVSGSKRATGMPDVPTIAEAGVTGFDVVTWEAILAPAGTPAAIVARLNGALREVLATPAIRDQMIQMGMEPDGTKSPSEVTAYIKREEQKFSTLIRERHIEAK
ncbi:tripartite tricarboxylate transporter substrate binding protein [Bordetella bronchialis]|uniref:tripartite tricarboxylate transporter substrate binding protein n=1 Tax=Bordetella bronchialis TaxID=463025 RepID=UPI003D0892C7